MTFNFTKREQNIPGEFLFNSQITFACKIMPHRNATVSPTATVVSAYLNLCGIRTILAKNEANVPSWLHANNRIELLTTFLI